MQMTRDIKIVYVNADSPYDQIRSTESLELIIEAPIGAPFPRDILVTFVHVIVDIFNFLLNKFAFKIIRTFIKIKLQNEWCVRSLVQ